MGEGAPLSRDHPEPSALLAEQLAYYRARAGEYDEWWNRRGRYDRGAEDNARWFEEAAEARSALECFAPSGDVLELAGGTGIWTRELLPLASSLTVVDGAAETLALNAERLGSPEIRYVVADIFEWVPDRSFDTVFFAFWLSHVPERRFEPFWQLVERSLRPGGRFFFIDSRRDPTATAVDQRLPEALDVMRRRLNDGREFRVVKVFHEPAPLAERLSGLGWETEISETSRYFVYGSGGRRSTG